MSGVSKIIERYKHDPASVYNTWFIGGEERLKAFRSIRRGVLQVIEEIKAEKFGNDFKGSSLEVVLTAITEQKQVFEGAAHPFYWKPKMRISDIYENQTNKKAFGQFLENCFYATREDQPIREIIKLNELKIKGLGPAVANFLAEHDNVDAEIEAASKEYERLKAIEDIAAKRDLVESEARYQKARQNKELYDKLTSGQSDHSRTISLRSPIAGIVGNFTFSIGATVNASEVIFTVYDLSKVYIEAQVFDNDAAKVNQATRFAAESTQDANKKAEVKLLAPAQTINPTNQSQKVIFEMDNKDGTFKIGEFVNLRAFGAKASQQLTIPNSTIKEINGKPVIFMKDNAEQYSVSYLTTGTDDGERTIVLKGLEAGERVVSNASYQVKMIYQN